MHRVAPLILILGIIAAACGGSTGESATSGSGDSATTTMVEGGSGNQTPIVTTESSIAAPTATASPVDLPDSDYPDVVVTDLAGGTVNLRELALGSQPTLVWFWAPH